MQDTQGLTRGMDVFDTGAAISVPTGEAVTWTPLQRTRGQTLDGKAQS
jgi:F0F1-type ATP synthase beta subunit